MKITNTLKQKSKKLCSLSAYVIASILVTSPLAFAVPFQVNQGTINTMFRSISDSASGCLSSTLTCFFASAYDDFYTGEQQGVINVYTYSEGSVSQIYCSGPAYAGIVSVNQGNGNTSVKATLNPLDPSCYPNNWTAGIVTVNLSGSYVDGGVRFSNNGKSTSYSNGTTYKINATSASFEAAFTGSITGYSGPWAGFASASRYSERQQVK